MKELKKERPKREYKKKFNFQHELCIQIIEKLLKPERLEEKNIWGREVKILKILLPKYPNVRFWAQLNLGYLLNSLAFFLSNNGNKVISQKWGHFLLENPAEEEYVLGTKVENDILEKKPKTLIEILT